VITLAGKHSTSGSVKITQALLNGLKATGKRETYHDSTVQGLMLRVGPDAVSRVWYLGYRNQQHIKCWFRIGSTKQFSLKAAKAEARKLQGHIEDGHDPAAEKRAARVEAATAEKRSLAAYMTGPYWEQHLRHAKTGMATKQRIKHAWRPFLGTDIAKLQSDKLNSHRSKRRAEGVNVTTLNRDRTALIALLNHAVEAGVLEVNPLQRFKKLPEPADPRVRFLEVSERRQFMNALEEQPDYMQTLVQLALFTGMRRGELFALTWPEVNLRRGEITVRASTAKANKTRVIPLPAPALDMLKAWKAKQPVTDIRQHVFLNPDTGKPFAGIKRRWRALVRTADVQDFRFHDCRHDYASRLVQSGVDLYRVKELLGHSSIEMTQRYAHLQRDDLRAAVEVLASDY
jgi:integrase